MSFQLRPTRELMQIASSGGGLVLDAALRPTTELMQIAAAAKDGGARLILRGMTLRPTLELMQIASAGGGTVVFSGDTEPNA